MRSKQLLFTGLLCGASLLMGAGTHLNARERGFTPAATPATNTALSFVENIGQVHNQRQQPRPDIDFRLNAGKGLSVFIGSGQIHYQWSKSIKSGPDPLLRTDGQGLGDGSRQQGPDTPVFKMYRMDVALVGANPNATIITVGEQDFHERYFQPWVNKKNSNQGVVAHSYGKITYKNVYPNIDWVLHVKHNTVEYDFVVRPGGKVSDIRLQYGGATKLALQADGSLLASTPMGKVREQAPYSYQEDGSAVASGFVLKDNTLSFTTGEYTGTLTIDPALEWATYFGDLGEDIAYGLASDNNNNVYMTGVTSSMSNIATSGSFQDTMAGSTDAFVTKFDAAGNCVWATYFGGANADRGTAICLTPDMQDVYFSGVTNSATGIATTGSFQDTLGGGVDAFLAKFDTSGQRVWCSYYGGSGSEGSGLIAGVSCNRSGKVFLSGETASDNNISTPGSYQGTRAGGIDAFLTQFDSSGQRLWGTYFGGSGSEYGRRTGCDSLGNVYLAGYGNSSSGIATAGAYQSTFGGVMDAFLAKFDTTGNLQWATYFGGSALETFSALAVHADGTAYIAGGTSSTGLATSGTHQDTIGGLTDGYLASFANNGQLNWATYLGGESSDFIFALAVSNQAIYAGGVTASLSGISTPGAYQDTANTFPAFIVSFDNSGQRNWGTYYGGSGADWINSMFITNTERLFVAGQTYSGTGLSTPGSFQSNFGGGTWDAFLTKFNVCETPEQPGAIIGDTVLCSGQAYTFSIGSVAGALSYTWTLPNDWTGSSDSTSISIIPAAGSGSIAVAANNSCATSDSSTLNITVNASPEPVIVNTNGILSTTLPYSSYQWNQDGQAINGATAATYTVTANGAYSVSVTNTSGCSGTSDTLNFANLGIENLQGLAKSIAIYPNPTRAMVHIQSPVKVDIEILSLEGRLLRRVKNAETFSLKNLAPGMYLLKIYDRAGQLVKVTKIVRQ